MKKQTSAFCTARTKTGLNGSKDPGEEMVEAEIFTLMCNLTSQNWTRILKGNDIYNTTGISLVDLKILILRF